MSQYGTPFIVINLGCEMIYVIDQRLKSQRIPIDKSNRVLTDIVTVMLHPKILDELFIPQPIGSHAVIKQLLQDISATTIMKLDDYSMSKLWDLITMIHKWQLSSATNQNIFDISRRHLRCVGKLMPDFFSKSVIEYALRKFETVAQKFTDGDYKCLYNTLILWFSEYHTKISVLLRLGLQNKDGTFNLPSTIEPKILQNLGENIYKYDSKKYLIDDYDNNYMETGEIKCLLATIEQSTPKKKIKIRLPVEFVESNDCKTLQLDRKIEFEIINPNLKNKSTDLTFKSTVPKSPHEDLLQMLDETSFENHQVGPN